MASPELFAPVRIRKVAAHVHKQIQGTAAIISGLDAKDLEQFSLIEVETGGKDRYDFVSLVKITEKHGRNYEVKLDGLENVIFQDQYGNFFSALTLKGNNLTNPHIFKQNIAPSGYAIYGLQDSDSIKRVLKVSDLLRQNHVDTEMIVGVIEPLKLPHKGKDIPLAELKSELIKDLFGQSLKTNSVDLNELTSASNALDKMTFFITLRAMQLPERLNDLELCHSEEDFNTIMQRTFAFINHLGKERAKKSLGSAPEFFDSNKKSVSRYLTGYLPTKVAANLARMHNLGLVHTYPHAGNITLSGALVDLDSVRGITTGCDDEPVTDDQMKADVTCFLNDAWTTIEVLSKKRFLGERYVFENQDLASLTFRKNFLHAYIKERGWKNNIAHHIESIFDYAGSFMSRLDEDFLKECLSELTAQTGFEYEYHPDPEFISKIFYKEQEEIWQDEIDHALGALTEEEYEDKQRLRNRRREDAVIFNSPKFTRILFNSIMEEINIQKAPQLQQLEQQYGAQASHTIASMFAIRGLWKSRDQLPYFLDAAKTDYYKKFIADLGWEKNIVAHLDKITAIFQDFGPLESQDAFKYYHNLLTAQLGINFKISDPIEKILGQFYDYDQQEAKELIDAEMALAKPDGQIDNIFDRALYGNQNTLRDPFPIDRFTDFIVRMVDMKAQEVYEAKFSEISSKYGSDIANSVIWMVIKAETDRIIEETSQFEDEINRIGDSNIGALKDSYLSKLSLTP